MSNPCQRVLVVDDEADIRELLEITLGRMGLETRAAATLDEAQRLLATERFDLCLTDMRLPDGDGLTLVETIQQRHGQLPVAVITAYGAVEHAVRALKAGAFDFVSKPVELDDLRRLVQSALRLGERSDESGDDGRRLIGESPMMQRLRATIRKVARSQAPVHITGESGTGKEVIARAIHAEGPRATGPFVPVNCGAIPAELMESEFFGHRKGSFTGANRDKPGLFQSAEGGTLFLDEIADLPMHMQVKLLRAIQEKAVRPVGEEREVAVDVRILSASHRPLARLVEQGAFRQDLFYRINVIELTAPPLRDRPGDIPALCEHILGRIAGDYGRPVPELSPSAVEALRGHAFPGNVRELENILERAAALCEGDRIEVADLGLEETGPAPGPVVEEDAGVPPSADPDAEERARILRALDAHRWNRTRAARQLGLTLRQLRYRIEKLGL